MSSDNGIYVLETSGPEYRVKHALNIDAIYGKFNDDTGHWNGNDEVIKDFFKEAPVFNSLLDAMEEAENQSKDYDYLEYGICVITDFKNKVFAEL